MPRSPTAITVLPSGEATTDLRSGRGNGGSAAARLESPWGAPSRHLTLFESDLQVAPAFSLLSSAPSSPTTRTVRPPSATATSCRIAAVVTRRANAFLSTGVINHRRASICSWRPGRGAPSQLRSAAPRSGSATTEPMMTAISPAASNAQGTYRRKLTRRGYRIIAVRPGEAERVCEETTSADSWTPVTRRAPSVQPTRSSRDQHRQSGRDGYPTAQKTPSGVSRVSMRGVQRRPARESKGGKGVVADRPNGATHVRVNGATFGC